MDRARIGALIDSVLAQPAGDPGGDPGGGPGGERGGELEMNEALVLDRAHRWTVSFEPSIWVPALQGDIGVGGSAVFDVGAIDLDKNEATPFGRFTIRSSDLTIEFSGFSFNSDQSATANQPITIAGTGVATGGGVSYDLTQTSFELTVGYRVWSVPVGIHNPDPNRRTDDLEIWVDGYAGVRGFDIDLDFSTPATAGQGIEDIHAIVGVGLNMDLPEGFGLRFSADAGGGANGSSFDLTFSFDYEIVDHVSAQIGYRYLRTDLQDGGFNYDVALAGLFASIALRF